MYLEKMFFHNENPLHIKVLLSIAAGVSLALGLFQDLAQLFPMMNPLSSTG
jgi:hypothetical protein